MFRFLLFKLRGFIAKKAKQDLKVNEKNFAE